MKKSSKIMVLVFICLLACVGLVSADKPVLAPGDTSDAGITPYIVDSNIKTCAGLAAAGVPCTGTEFDIQSPYPGTYDLGTGQTITIDQIDDHTIAWSTVTNTKVSCIFMKGADGGDVYSYCYPAGSNSGDSGLTTAKVNGNYAGISHIVLCYITAVYPPPVPEFPTVALPVGMLIGLVGLVYFVRTRE